jgi:predicted DNA-binding transcriptional regulator AlpA
MPTLKPCHSKCDLEQFDLKPDSALVNIETLSTLLCRSRASIYRDLANPSIPLPRPVKLGHSSRWRVGEIRQFLNNTQDAPTEDRS